STNNGIANIVKSSIPVTIRCAAVTIVTSNGKINNSVIIELKIIANAIGKPMIRKMKKVMNNTNPAIVVINHHRLQAHHALELQSFPLYLINYKMHRK